MNVIFQIFVELAPKCRSQILNKRNLTKSKLRVKIIQLIISLIIHNKTIKFKV